MSIAHIVNLIVQDGLKTKDELVAISRIRGAVRYVKSSPARYKRFLECVEIEKIETKKLLSLDVPTRWNSTYFMLESAISLQRAFDAFGDVDRGYGSDLVDGIPTEDDWDRARLLLNFLEPFYTLTLCIFGSYITSNNVLYEISSVELLLKQWLESDDFQLKEMSKRMKSKFDKYWGSIEKMNMNLYYAVILDPRRKMLFLDFVFNALYDESIQVIMKAKIEFGIQELFSEYRAKYDTFRTGSSQSSRSSASSILSSKQSMNDSQAPTKAFLLDQFNKFKCGGKTENVKSELEKYLSEEAEDEGVGNFDVLAIPVSTVASLASR